MQVQFENEEERASATQALCALWNDREFLSDAWNQDLYVTVARAAGQTGTDQEILRCRPPGAIRERRPRGE